MGYYLNSGHCPNLGSDKGLCDNTGMLGITSPLKTEFIDCLFNAYKNFIECVAKMLELRALKNLTEDKSFNQNIRIQEKQINSLTITFGSNKTDQSQSHS